MFQPKPVKTDKKFVSVAQANFPKGYISTLSDSRMPLDGLASMVNMWLEQDSVPRPRPPFNPYGQPYLGPCHGADKFNKFVSGSPQYWEISMQNIPVNAVQTVSIANTPTGGTFTLTLSGHTTSALNWDATATNVRSALEALPNVGTGNVATVGGALPGIAITITFQGALANTDIATLTSTDSFSGGSDPASHITVVDTGGPVATVCVRKDGESWDQVTDGSPVYDLNAWTTFTQGAAINTDGTEDIRVYVNNGVNNMSYYDVTSGDIVQYIGLDTPDTPTLDETGLSGSNFTQYYVVTANDAGGESAPSTAATQAISTERAYWDPTSENIVVTWDAVTDATSYSLYTGDIPEQLYFLATVSGLTFTDNGSIATNLYKSAPVSDSSSGPILDTMVNVDNQLFGCGDPNNPNYLWYSGQAYHFGDFSFNPQGGGYALIDYGGDTVPTAPFAFQDGKGNPVVSILTYGQAGRGKLLHFTTTTQTVGTTTLTFPDIYEASSKDGSPSPRGIALYNNNAYYCTGVQFKTTGIKPNIINILSTDTIFNQGLPDLQTLTLSALDQSCSLEYLGKIYFFLPVNGSTTNNQCWILDLTRGGLWILEWPINVQAAWLYEDNSGNPHFLTLQDGICLELDLLRTSIPTQDNGVAFSTTLASGSMVFDKGGVAMFSSYYTYFKFLYPLGIINVDISGITEDAPNTSTLLVSGSVDAEGSESRGGYGQMLYSNPTANLPITYSGDIGTITQVADTINVLDLEVDAIVNQQSWEITTNEANCDYLLSSVTTTGYTIPRLYVGQ